MCVLQQTPPRRIYRRIKRENGPSKSATAAQGSTPGNPLGRASVPQPTTQAQPVLDFDVAEARKAAARWGHMGAQSAPLMIWPLHPGESLQAQVARADRAQDRGQDTEEPCPPMLVEESSSGSRVNSKKRSAPTTLVNTPQMLQQLAKEESSRGSTCSSNSDETGSEDSDDSEESEPDVVSRQQHPFGMQNGLEAAGPGVGVGHKGAASQNPGISGSGPLPAALPRSMSPVPVGLMTAKQIKQRREQEMAMPSTGYHVSGGVPVPHRAAPSGGHGMQADPVPVHLKHALMGKQMLDMVDGFGRAPLHVAAAAGRVDVVQQLLFGGCDFTKALQADFRYRAWANIFPYLSSGTLQSWLLELCWHRG